MVLSRPVVALVALCLLVLPAHVAVVSSEQTMSGVYVKLFPGKELCVLHEAYRDPEGDPITVSFQHRALDPRLAGIRTHLYGPGDKPGARGELITLHESLDTFGDLVGLYFEAGKSGTYTMCLMSPKRQPIMRFEMKFVAVNEIIQPTVTEDDAVVYDKPPEMRDYKDRLKMLAVSVETTADELRMYQLRRFMFDYTTNSTFYVVIASVVFNLVLAVGLSMWTEKYLESFFMKRKIA